MSEVMLLIVHSQIVSVINGKKPIHAYYEKTLPLRVKNYFSKKFISHYKCLVYLNIVLVGDIKERLSKQSPIETDLVFCLLKKEYKFEKYIDRYIVF